MHDAYVNTVFDATGNARRTRSAREHLLARRRFGLVGSPGTAGVTDPGPLAADVSVRSAAPFAARRRWFRRSRRDELATCPPTDIEFTWGNRQPGTAGFARWAAAAGQRVAERGVNDSARDVDNVVDVATSMGVQPVAVSVLADADAPEPARLRAFAVVVAALVSHGAD